MPAGDAEDEARARRAAIQPDDPYTIIYTSGTTGPPKGCVLTHGNYRAMLDSVETGDLIIRRDDLTYLYLPLAHALALLMQLRSFEVGAAIAYFGGDTRQIVAELAEVRPTYLPSVPRIFEKIYAGVTASVDPGTLRHAVAVGGTVRDMRLRGEAVPPDLQAPFDALDGTLFARVRGAFGGRLREAVTGAAPIATEILEFFWACGVPVLEGYGMTETATGASICTLEAHRFGTVGRALPGVDIRIADDGEILVRGANVFRGYHGDAEASFGAVVDGWLHTGDLGSLDADGYLTISGRKKDIIITAGGKNLTPANLENDLRQMRFVSQAVMYGDRRPYPVMLITLDAEEIVPWAAERGLPDDLCALAREPEVVALIEAEVDRANARYAPVEQVKRVADPRPRPEPGGRRVDADAQGQAQRRLRALRGRVRRALRHSVVGEARRREHAPVARDAQRLVAVEPGGPARAGGPHREGRRRVGVGQREVRADDGHRQQPAGRRAGVRIDDVGAALVLA